MINDDKWVAPREATVVKLCSPNMLRSGFLRFLIFTTRVDQTNGSTLVKLILFEKSRVELEFVLTIIHTTIITFLKF